MTSGDPPVVYRNSHAPNTGPYRWCSGFAVVLRSFFAFVDEDTKNSNSAIAIVQFDGRKLTGPSKLAAVAVEESEASQISVVDQLDDVPKLSVVPEKDGSNKFVRSLC
jgi:hypothetical protein